MLLNQDIAESYRQVVSQIAADGVAYIATYDDSGGAPSVAPSTRSGCVGMCFGTSTKKLYVYTGSAWIASAALA
jgi:hypothetical protein